MVINLSGLCLGLVGPSSGVCIVKGWNMPRLIVTKCDQHIWHLLQWTLYSNITNLKFPNQLFPVNYYCANFLIIYPLLPIGYWSTNFFVIFYKPPFVPIYNVIVPGNPCIMYGKIWQIHLNGMECVKTPCIVMYFILFF